MKLVSLLPVSRRAIELLKARNPKLIQRPIVVHGSMGNYIRNAWILPEEADKENPRAAQFDLFDQGQPAKRKEGHKWWKEALAETDEKELANEKADAESLRRMIKESKKPSSDIAVLDQRIKEAHDLGMIMQDMKEDRERDAAYQVRVDAAEKYRGGDYEKYLVAYDAVALDSQKIGNTIQHSKSPEKIAAFAVQYVNSLGNAVPMSFAEKVEKLAKEYGKKIDTTEWNDDRMAQRYMEIMREITKDPDWGKEAEQKIMDSWKDRIIRAIKEKDAYGLEFLANGLNEGGKRLFNEVTGEKLPKGQKATWDAIRKWAGVSEESHKVKVVTDEYAYAKEKFSKNFREQGEADKFMGMLNARFDEGFTVLSKINGKTMWYNPTTMQGMDISSAKHKAIRDYVKAYLAYRNAIFSDGSITKKAILDSFRYSLAKAFRGS